MTTIIHQPYFLPWLGYFSKISFADKFIILDNVHFTKGFYHDRTKYINADGEVKWLSIPIGQHFQIDLNKILIVDKCFLTVFIKTIESCYAKADYYKTEWPYLKKILSDSILGNDRLIDINLSLIKLLLDYFEIKHPEFIFSSNLGFYNDKSERIISLCKSVNADSIIIGGGKSIEHHNWEKVRENGINVLLQDYFKEHPEYKQIRRQRIGFQKGVSILDSILNVGRSQTKNFITNDIYKPVEFNFSI
jgi:hypothetical protein